MDNPKDIIRCICGNCWRFIATRSPESGILSRCLLIQENGRLYIVKGSTDRIKCEVPFMLAGRPWHVHLSCAKCTPYSPGGLTHPEIPIERIEKEYWRPDDKWIKPLCK